MVSYKTLYENLKKQMEESSKPIESDYQCPKCGKQLMETRTMELYCIDEECDYDKTSDELLGMLEDSGYLERMESD